MHRFVDICLLLIASPALAKASIGVETAQRINQDVKAVLARTETPGSKYVPG